MKTCALFGLAVSLFLAGCLHSPPVTPTLTPVPTPSPTAAQMQVIFDQTESWRPCLPSDICSVRTTLFANGTLIMEFENTTIRQLTPETMDTILEAIRQSGILAKQCPERAVMDFERDTMIRLDGIARHIDSAQYWSCEEEIEELSTLILSGE